MAKSKKNKNRTVTKTSSFIESLVLIAYGYVTVVTPNLQTFDSNGPKFLAVAILNICVFSYFAYNRKFRNNLWLFFNNRIGIAYGVLILFSLLSFTKAINIHESILHFSKIITIFIAAWLISVVVYTNKKALFPLAITMCLLLLFDCFSVFKGMSNIISGKIARVGLIKSVYSNKNILVSSLFVKIPFALLLFYFYKGKVKYLGISALALAILATLFMSTRAFYLATAAFVFLLFVFSAVYYTRTKSRYYFKNSLLVLGIVLLNIGIYTFVQSNLYPKKQREARSIINRVASIADKGGAGRLKGWKDSFKLIKKEPLLGVGLGNWKIRILEYENKYSKNYTYMYKTHNDFLEISAETGVFGGLSFLAIFIFITWYFARILFKNPESDYLKWYFLVFFGIVAYFFDAFFNFPQDRPEIQALFALIVGATIGVSNNRKEEKLNK